MPWTHALRDAGFTGEVVFNHSDKLASQALIVAQPNDPDTHSPKRVTLLISQEQSSVSTDLAKIFTEHGISTDLCTLDQIPPPDSVIISLLDADQPFVYNINEERWQKLTTFISLLPSQQRLIWLTKSSDAKYSMVHGLARNIRFELGLDFATLDIDFHSMYLRILTCYRRLCKSIAVIRKLPIVSAT
ncbi:hypothetical protein AC578_9144 [Pseudocercospora eumusae]|uniref:Uncharacterized protein n=1 Tax=Pseudocercospora eumusae TaxID=321146 RepID=A0A139HVF3_9PEZI|nr:hypothetical protein AC578_9144 [Pseudocercospora eumusae]